mgnify:CR=1 FL=1
MLTSQIGYVDGYPTTFTNPEGETTTVHRDALGRIVDPTGLTIDYAYDTLGRLWKIEHPRISGTTVFQSNAYPGAIIYEYDNFDRVVKIHTPLGFTENQYDPATGFLEKTIDLLGRVTRYEYYAKGDLDRIIREVPGGIDLGDGTLTTEVVTDVAIDRYGNLTTVKPPGAGAINYTVDDLGRVTGVTEQPITPHPYTVWQQKKFTQAQILAGVADRENDPDRDGYSNEYEYFFRMNPLSGAQTPAAIVTGVQESAGDQYLTVSFTRKVDSEIAYRFQRSQDLQNWEYPGPLEVTNIILNADGTETLTMPDYEPISSLNPPKVFYRIQAINKGS